LWEGTQRLLERCRTDSPKATSLFLSVRGTPLTRYQVGRIIAHYIREAAKKCPAMAQKRLVAHSMRHTTAVHLLQAGAELNVIRSWLGHACIDSLQPYLDLDLTTKREVLESLVTPVFTKPPATSCRPRNEGGHQLNSTGWASFNFTPPNP